MIIYDVLKFCAPSELEQPRSTQFGRLLPMLISIQGRRCMELIYVPHTMGVIVDVPARETARIDPVYPS